jgi:NAD(P)-dependent dehydrogenase (short-subunit alcohol dehydrogenase family)
LDPDDLVGAKIAELFVPAGAYGLGQCAARQEAAPMRSADWTSLSNNAGIAGPTARVEDIQPHDWDRTVAIMRRRPASLLGTPRLSG